MVAWSVPSHGRLSSAIASGYRIASGSARDYFCLSGIKEYLGSWRFECQGYGCREGFGRKWEHLAPPIDSIDDSADGLIMPKAASRPAVSNKLASRIGQNHRPTGYILWTNFTAGRRVRRFPRSATGEYSGVVLRMPLNR